MQGGWNVVGSRHTHAGTHTQAHTRAGNWTGRFPLNNRRAMDIRQITPRYSVSPQISVEDVPAIKAAGITTVICNRPDAEVPPSHQAEALRKAVEQRASPSRCCP